MNLSICNTSRCFITLISILLWSCLLVSCKKKAIVKQGPFRVKTTRAISADVPEFKDYVGLAKAVREVQVRARVEGYLLKRGFQDGQDVQKGDILFEIDPAPFQAKLNQGIGDMKFHLAELEFAKIQYKRYSKLAEEQFTAQSLADQWRSTVKEYKANIATDRATITQYELDLGYCHVLAPFPGRIGRRMVDIGNLVGFSDATSLATIVQLDPIYIYFNPPYKIMHQLKSSRVSGFTPYGEIRINGSTHQTYQGKLDFINNQVEPTTSTVEMRLIVKNTKSMMLPGAFVEIRLHLGLNKNSVLVPGAAILRDSSGNFAFVIDKNNKLQRKKVVLGALIDGFQIVAKGLHAGDQIAIESLAKLHSKMSIEVELQKQIEPKNIGRWGLNDVQ